MQLLADVAAVCCVILLAVIVVLWRNMRKPEPRIVEPGKLLQQERRRALQDRRRKSRPDSPERRQHPRMDLAAGVVTSSQTVRSRSRGQGVGKAATADGDALQMRPDRAYFNADMGDLRDPDIGIPPAGGVLRPKGSLSKPEYR